MRIDKKTLWIDDWRFTTGRSTLLREHKVPHSGSQDKTTPKEQGRSSCCTRVGLNMDDWKRRSKFTPFRKGDKVWLDSRNLQTLYHKKMAPRREGLFEIVNVLGLLTYQLKLPEMWRIHDVFHTSLLWQYRENNVYGTNYDRPPAKLNNEGQEVYNIETILKHQRRGQGYQYYVK